jgi:predicted NAD/FAD-dependent oxidoreductase
MASQYKVVIVGAGVAGLYAAWRMCVDATAVTGLEPSDILVIEAASRTGGRLFTKQLPEFFPNDTGVPTGLRAELGGMRFLNFHVYVQSLAAYLQKELGSDSPAGQALTPVAFEADDPGNWHYLRGKVMQSFNNQAAPVPTLANETVYALTQQEHADMQPGPNPPYPTPGNLVANALLAAFNHDTTVVTPATSGATLQQMVADLLSADAPGSGAPLWTRGLWNVLVEMGATSTSTGATGTDPVSNEAYEFWADAGAYDSVPSNWNAATAAAMLLSDFSSGATYFALQGGYQALCDTLYSQLQAKGVKFDLDTTVSSVTRILSSGYEVATSSLSVISADNVILALPPRAIELIEQKAATLVGDITDALQQCTPVPLVKVFLVYKNSGSTPWWSTYLPGGVDDLPQFTRLTTDLPLRQVYNFGTCPDSTGANTYSLIQVSYSDVLRAGYWAGLMSAEPGQAVDTGIFADPSTLPGATSASTGYVEWTDNSALPGHPLFSAAHEQFVTLLTQIASNCGTPLTPADAVVPSAGAAMDWGADPFGGGYNVWNVGVDVASAYGGVLNPQVMEGGSAGPTGTGGLFIVGEGYSQLQGWVEGALWTVEDALKAAYGSAWSQPSWLDPVAAPSPPPAGAVVSPAT